MQVSSYPKINAQLARQLLQPRPNNGHKGTFGHLLLVGGHFGMMGAAILSAEAALRTGLGKLTAHVPETANIVFQTRLPEVILHFDEQSHQHWASIKDLNGYNAIAIGPGIGKDGETQWAFRAQLKMLLDLETSGNPMPLVLDADALNILAQDYQLLTYLPRRNRTYSSHRRTETDLRCSRTTPRNNRRTTVLSSEHCHFSASTCSGKKPSNPHLHQ